MIAQTAARLSTLVHFISIVFGGSLHCFTFFEMFFTLVMIVLSTVWIVFKILKLTSEIFQIANCVIVH